MLACIQSFTDRFASNLVSALQFDISLDDLDIYLRCQLYGKSTTSVSIFSQISKTIWMAFSMLPQPIGFLKLKLSSFYTSHIQGILQNVGLTSSWIRTLVNRFVSNLV